MSQSRIESQLDVQAYLLDLKYALEHGAKINFQIERMVDTQRDIHFTNKFTVGDLFPDEDPVDALRHELRNLTVREYIRTVKDTRFPKRSEMREFGRTYNGHGDVYIKIRVELLNPQYGCEHTTFVMSFHYAERPFRQEDFPYAE